jgi:hypothetical protein
MRDLLQSTPRPRSNRRCTPDTRIMIPFVIRTHMCRYVLIRPYTLDFSGVSIRMDTNQYV